MKLQNLQRRFFQRFVNRWIPVRVLICIMAFTCTWTSYVCRLQMPILALPMIVAKPPNATIEGVCVPEAESRSRRSIDDYMPIMLNPETMMIDQIMDEKLRIRERRSVGGDTVREARPPDAPIEIINGKPFDWTFTERGQLIAAYGYGNIPGNLLGGMMSMRWGPRRVVFWTACVAAILSLVSPILAQIHWTVLGLSRIIVGLTGGVTFPSCHTLIAKWAPPDEKARFVWSLLGGTFGTILTYPLISYIAEEWSWELGWYIPSLFMIVWLAVWYLIAYDSPEEHPGISEEEKTYILTAQAGTVQKDKPTFKQTPVKEIFTSIPFISLVCCHFGNLWLIFFYQNALMIYLTKALGFKLTKGGIVAGLPWAARMSFGFFFSWAGDTIKRKQILSVTALRKTATVFSHLICALFILGVSYVGCAFVLANVFLFLALGFNGAASIANLSNNQDLAPNFAGFLYGIMNTIGTFAGAIIPLLVEEIAGKYGNPIHKWQILFWITSGVTIASMAIFIIGGSGKIQSWNELKPTEGAKDAEASNPAAKT